MDNQSGLKDGDRIKSKFVREAFGAGKEALIEAFTRDLRLALLLDEKQRAEFLAELPALQLASTPYRRREILARLSGKIGLSPAETGDVARPLLHLMRQLNDPDRPADDWSHWAGDLQQVSAIGESQRQTFESLIRSLKSSAEEVQPVAKRRSFVQRLAPTLGGVDAVAGVVGVTRGEYALGMRVEDYAPVVDDVVPMVALKLKLDDAPLEQLTIHLEETDLDLLVDSLAAAKKDVQALRRFLNKTQ
jgi:multidrug efflux pump subunit AcrA (membrane-fusion protein)